MIKTIIILLYLLSRCSVLLAQESYALKEQVNDTKPTELPYVSIMRSPFVVRNLPSEERQNLPMYVYNELRGIDKVKEKYCAIFRYFNSTNGSYKIFLIALGEYLNFRKLLVAYDLSYKMVSWIEVEYGFDPFYNVMQWRLNKDMTVETYNIKILGDKRVEIYDNPFKELKAQRIDAFYKIDSLGHFQKQKEIFYVPRMYQRSYFEGKNRPIWEGDEEVKETKEY